MLKICTFLWGDKYSLDYVRRLFDGVSRNLTIPHELVLVTSWSDAAISSLNCRKVAIVDIELTKIRGCFARLRLFDPEFQSAMGMAEEDRVVSMDLDSVVTGPLDRLFEREEPFVILTGANAENPCPFNGSIWMLKAGHRPDVWSDFSLTEANKLSVFDYPDDQAWFAHKMPSAAGWKAGSASGVYAFHKPGWPGKKNDHRLPKDARIVVFPGWRDPSKFSDVAWIKQHWK